MKGDRYFCGHATLRAYKWQEGGIAFWGRAPNGWAVKFKKSDIEAGEQTLAEEILAMGATRSPCELGSPPNEPGFIE